MIILTSEDCKKILRKFSSIATFKHFCLTNFDECFGFLSEQRRLEIKFLNNNGNEETATFFVKIVPFASEKYMEYVKTVGYFKKEALLYNNLLPYMQNYFKEKFLPAKYLANPDLFIVLDDLKNKGYECHKALSLEHCFCLVETLARLHSSSIIFEEKRSNKQKVYRISDHFSTELMETVFVFEEGHPRQRILKNALKAILDIIDQLEYENSVSAKNNIEVFARENVKILLKASKKYRNTLTHCDLWRNNVMFRTIADKLECVLIDFQHARYAPPAWDVLLTLHLNFDLNFLNEHMKTLLNHYYDCVRKNLAANGLDVKELFNENDFFESLNVYRPIALLHAIVFGTMVFLDDDFKKRMVSDERVFEEYTYTNRTKYAAEKFKTDAVFRRSLKDILIPLIDCLKNVDVQ